ncbi:DUF6603 domain-containing protein [Ideonella sp.]|uniref:DUF6603 domain-containing protein n=1 Tax=Ideonella sp. TaxID=1929293 RepID=UPI0035B2B0BA
MSGMSKEELGVLGNLAVALGVFDADGQPNGDWFGHPEESLKNMLAKEGQREALIAFVDEALGGADRTTDPRGVIWLPIVQLDDPDLLVAVTVDESPAAGLHIGLGIAVRTSGPDSSTSLSIPLFLAHRDGGPNVSNPLLLGSAGGRIRIATDITVDSGAPVPGQARLGAIGLDVDLPTLGTDPKGPVFGLALTGFQLPGAQQPRDLRVAADGLDELDDALLDLILSLVKAQADAAAGNSLIAAVGGLLGLRSGDAVPDFPITQLPTQGVQALADWVHGILTTPAQLNDWVGHLATLLGGTAAGASVDFDLGGAAELTLGLQVGSGPSGHTTLTPTLAVSLGNDDARVEAQAALFRIDLETGAAQALPSIGAWAAVGRGTVGHRVIDVTNPTVVRADTLRLGFGIDAQRRLNFVLAADAVTLGAHSYPTLDLTSPDAVMDAVGNTVGDVLDQLLAGCGDALDVVRLLLGLDAPNGVPAVSVSALMSDPLAAAAGYWQALLAAPPAAMTEVLEALRDALADASEAVAIIHGTGTALDPWRVPLIGPLELEFAATGSTLAVNAAIATSVDSLGQRCTVVDMRLAATLARIDLAAKTAVLMPGVEGRISARERGVDPPRVTLALGDAIALTASGVGLGLAWAPGSGLSASLDAPNLTLRQGNLSLPVALPVIAADGSVTLPPEAWSGVESLVGYLGELAGGFFGQFVAALGWTAEVPTPGDDRGARLPLADLIDDPAAALALWLPQLAMSELGPEALSLLADLFRGAGANRGLIQGTGHPDDPYRLALADGLPEVAVWFPPQGLEPRLVAAPPALQRWRPGEPGLSADVLALALSAESEVADDVNALVDGRDLAGGLAALAERWVGGDGRVLPPAVTPADALIDRAGLAVGQLPARLDLQDLTGRVPGTVVYVALQGDAAADVWATGLPADHLVDLSTAGLDASMFTAPTPATGAWLLRLGTRAACKLAGSATDGTPEQAARLARVLDVLASVSNDIVLVALAGAGHAARLAAQAQAAVTDLITLGTPLGPISLTALTTQPTADALRLLHRLLPAPVDTSDPDTLADDEDLALGRALVGAMMELSALADPGADLRPPMVPPAAARAGLAITAVFGTVTADQVARATTAIVAAGLAERARERATMPLPEPSGVQAGLLLPIAPTANGSLKIRGEARLTLFAYDLDDGIDTTPTLRTRLKLSDRSGWLASTPELELRMLSAELLLKLDGADHGQTRLTLHDARFFDQSWERLLIGNTDDALPLLPEARSILAAAAQRLTADAAGTASLALRSLWAALGLVAPDGSLIGDAVDTFVHDAGGLLRQRLAQQQAALSSAISALLGPLGASVNLAAQSVHLQGGGDGLGRFGWQADVLATTAGLTGQLRFGPSTPLPTTGNLQLLVDLDPFTVTLLWQQASGGADTIPLWPAPDAMALARAIAKAAPSLGGHAALELMRRADDSARPIIDALLDALGLLRGLAGDTDRALRPLAGLLADPAGWLRSADSLAANPGKIQGLFDAMRPLLGIAGAPGTPIALATGVSLSVVAAGPGARLTLDVDPSGWAAPNGITGRLAAGLGATLTVGPSGPPVVGVAAHVGLTGAPAGKQAVHALLSNSGLQVFVRPASGPDISLVPFSGLGALAAAAEAALPFLLDQLAALPSPTGPLVAKVGDALNLRNNTPAFDGAKLQQFAANPVGALEGAALSIAQTGLDTIAPLLDTLLPAGITVTGSDDELHVTISEFTLSWTASDGTVTLAGHDVPVPGLDALSFTLALNAAGLKELSATAGPMVIDAGGVILRPFITVAAGSNPAGGRRVALGMALDDTHRFALRWLLDTHAVALVSSDGLVGSGSDDPDPLKVALRIVEVVADLVAAVAMAQQPVQDLLDSPVGDIDVRNLLRGVVLADVADPQALIAGLFDPATLLARIHKLFSNLAGAGIEIKIDAFTVAFLKIDNVIGVQVGVDGRFPLVTGDVMLWLENDDSWITPNPPGDGGLFVGFLPGTLPLAFKPSLVVNGLGLRVGKNSGPLLDIGLSLDSIALHAYAAIDGGGAKSGGVQLQFSNLAVSAGGAKGDNGIAQGVMKDTGPTPPKPAFSPALAIQVHNGGAVAVTLRAGDPPGPWWIAIQKGFGPLYLEQIGFGATEVSGKLERISLLMDGSVSMFGLTCTVDDLQITYLLTDGDFFNADNWRVDLAGLAVSADMAGVQIAGGLLKQTTPAGIEYLGMLLGRFGVYGLTIYGGYGEGNDNGQKFTAFFAVGAIIGPIGGPPAFFLTGIGGGLGINRKLVVPTELSNFGDYPLIQALDIAASPQDPMTQLRALGAYFPMQKGTFWFAAGVSFNSFALVDGIAVLGIQIGDGLDINLLGLARMALPRPQVALVSIELALLVRFSSSEGVLWVQGQLTDNSWLLYPDVKLTGGFAYVIWFKGEHAGEFVLTLGGYHPDFHRDGYPVVPRLGLRWSIGDYIVIKSGSYFALTSEALMAGGDFEASAHFGPAWAEVKFGANGIVYFDPFHYQVDAYARIAAGITIDTWIFGEITISISLGARIDVSGPDFHGKVTFEIGPVELTVEFGGSDKSSENGIAAQAFITKYLDAGDATAADAHALMTSFGAQPSAKGQDATPDGSVDKPFVVVAEFGLTFTSTVPAVRVNRVNAGAGAVTNHAPSTALAVAPMKVATIEPEIKLTWQRNGATETFPFVVTARPHGRFPAGVWGKPQDPHNRKVPKGDMIEALCELDFVSTATPSAPGPEIAYYQVETGPRQPLPFTRRAIDAAKVKAQAKAVTDLVTPPDTVSAAFHHAGIFMADTATPTLLASLRGERQAPPLLGTLTEGLDDSALTTIPGIGQRPPGKVYDHFIDPPLAVGLLSGVSTGLRVAPPARTTVRDSARAWRVAPPTIASVEAQASHSIAARLTIADTPAMTTGRTRTVLGVGALPPTAVAHAAPAIVARPGAGGSEPLGDFSAGLLGQQGLGRTRSKAARAEGSAGAVLTPGQVVVLKLPNAKADAALDGVKRPQLAVLGAAARVVVLSHGGNLMADRLVGGDKPNPASLEIAQGAERIVAVAQGAGMGQGDLNAAPAGLAGWHAGLQMPYVGWSAAIGPGCVMQSQGPSLKLHRERRDGGWVNGAELARGVSTVTTTFSEAPNVVVVVLDDPAAFGNEVGGRQLLLGLDGAERLRDAAGRERAPQLLAMENRSVLAYEIVPQGDRPVVVTIASDEGWSLVGVMGSAQLDAKGAIALISARGLDAVLQPFAQGTAGGPASQLQWQGPTRTDGQRKLAQAKAMGRHPVAAGAAAPSRAPRKKSEGGSR